ncbi:A/G-specific adenine glycosylase [candidate division KSB1 bacterium]|nr:A/G-specific adenine glycosylase [candidate division KSB1 bacterium]
MTHKNDTRWIKKFRKKLTTWFESELRDLPWRNTKDPYKIWISEIMLQQTQVNKVIPYYLKFIESFPDIHSLANADLSHVLKIWEGLGYYGRARNLHKAAKEIIKNFQGLFPDDFESVRKLPGIGLYTAAAIMSIAFKQDYAVVDGNVRRVLCRLFTITGNPKSGQGKKIIQQQAQSLLATENPGDYNQAIMELGALICTPRLPKCRLCPVAEFCQAQKSGLQHEYPIKTAKKPRPHNIIAAGIIYKGDKILIARRPENGLLGGLWEFPGGKLEDGETPEQAVKREILEELGISVKVNDLFAIINHQYTHFTITLYVYNCEYISGMPETLGCADWRWVTLKEMDKYAFPRANRKILDQLLKTEKNNSADS